jgi:hypothetical protein
MGVAVSAAALAGSLPGTHNKAHAGFDTTVVSALKAGLLSQALTFMHIIETYYHDKWAAKQQILHPARTKIRHNWDEYVGTCDHNPDGDKVFDKDAIAWLKTRQQAVQTFMRAQDKVFQVLHAMDVNPINQKDPVNNYPFSHGHTISVAWKNQGTDIKQFAPTKDYPEPAKNANWSLGKAEKPNKPKMLENS